MRRSWRCWPSGSRSGSSAGASAPPGPWIDEALALRAARGAAASGATLAGTSPLQPPDAGFVNFWVTNAALRGHLGHRSGRRGGIASVRAISIGPALVLLVAIVGGRDGRSGLGGPCVPVPLCGPPSLDLVLAALDGAVGMERGRDLGLRRPRSGGSPCGPRGRDSAWVGPSSEAPFSASRPGVTPRPGRSCPCRSSSWPTPGAAAASGERIGGLSVSPSPDAPPGLSRRRRWRSTTRAIRSALSPGRASFPPRGTARPMSPRFPGTPSPTRSCSRSGAIRTKGTAIRSARSSPPPSPASRSSGPSTGCAAGDLRAFSR